MGVEGLVCFFLCFFKIKSLISPREKTLTFLGMCFHIRRIGQCWRFGAGQIKLPSTRVRGINVACNAVRVGVWSWKSSCAEERSQWSIVVDQMICLWQCCWNLVICLDCCGFWHCSTTPCKGLNVGNRMFYHVCHPKHFSTLAWHMQRSFKSHTQFVDKVAIALLRKTTTNPNDTWSSTAWIFSLKVMTRSFHHARCYTCRQKKTVTIIPMSNLVGSKGFFLAHAKYHAFQHRICCDLTLPRNMECCNVKKCRYNHQTSSLPTLSKMDNKMRVNNFSTSSEKIPISISISPSSAVFLRLKWSGLAETTVLIAELLIKPWASVQSSVFQELFFLQTQGTKIRDIPLHDFMNELDNKFFTLKLYTLYQSSICLII